MACHLPGREMSVLNIMLIWLLFLKQISLLVRSQQWQEGAWRAAGSNHTLLAAPAVLQPSRNKGSAHPGQGGGIQHKK